MKVHLRLVVVLIVTAMVSQWWSPCEAQLNIFEAEALYDLCSRPMTDLWANCSDAANACINTTNWAGITCNANKTAIVTMYDSTMSSLNFHNAHRHSTCVLDLEAAKARREDHCRCQLVGWLNCNGCATFYANRWSPFRPVSVHHHWATI